MKLHGYFRSSASYRVRIALNLKGLSAEHLTHHLRKGEQRAPDYLAINPQGLVPTLQDDGGAILTQSLAIIEWLDETHPEPPLLPKDPLRRAQVRAFAQALACDTHPVQNLKILARLRELGLAEEKVTGWAAWANREGLVGLREADRATRPGHFALAMRRRSPISVWCRNSPMRAASASMSPLFRACSRRRRLRKNLKAFADAAPERQPDAE